MVCVLLCEGVVVWVLLCVCEGVVVGVVRVLLWVL